MEDTSSTTMEMEREERVPLQHGCDDFWTWNRRERSSEVKLFGNQFRTAHFHPNWSTGTAGVRGTRVLNNGKTTVPYNRKNMVLVLESLFTLF